MKYDSDYLCSIQYRDGDRLGVRQEFHRKYGTSSETWFQWLAERVAWPAGATVLEAGCGTGTLWCTARTCIPHDLDLVLTDLSPGMVSEARTAIGRVAKYRTVTLAVADACALPADTASVDIVVANHMLYHVSTPSRAIREFARVLRRNGKLVAATNGEDDMKEIWAIRASVVGGTPCHDVTKVFSAQNGGQILRQYFESVTWEPHSSYLTCNEPRAVVAYLASMPPFDVGDSTDIRRLGDAVDDAFRACGGVLHVTKENGAFVCSDPRRK